MITGTVVILRCFRVRGYRCIHQVGPLSDEHSSRSTAVTGCEA